MNTYAYSPFGELIVEQEQVKLNIGFNTKYEDESGLIHYNNRYYDSNLGRFISQGPIFEEGGVNLYNFVENDPINHWDILGFDLDECFAADCKKLAQLTSFDVSISSISGGAAALIPSVSSFLSFFTSIATPNPFIGSIIYRVSIEFEYDLNDSFFDYELEIITRDWSSFDPETPSSSFIANYNTIDAVYQAFRGQPESYLLSKGYSLVLSEGTALSI